MSLLLFITPERPRAVADGEGAVLLVEVPDDLRLQVLRALALQAVERVHARALAALDVPVPGTVLDVGPQVGLLVADDIPPVLQVLPQPTAQVGGLADVDDGALALRIDEPRPVGGHKHVHAPTGGYIGNLVLA